MALMDLENIILNAETGRKQCRGCQGLAGVGKRELEFMEIVCLG